LLFAIEIIIETEDTKDNIIIEKDAAEFVLILGDPL
jgi:hypothetical protein